MPDKIASVCRFQDEFIKKTSINITYIMYLVLAWIHLKKETWPRVD